MLSAVSNLDKLSETILKLMLPHEKNDHRPFVLRSHGLTIFLVILLVSQAGVNLTTASGKVLGYATNISVSEIIRLTNNERAAAGLSSLKENPALNKAASLKGADMFTKSYWAHFAPDGTSPWYFFGLVGYQYSWAGENLARDFATSNGVVTAWVASSGHRANILNSNFSEIGVAVVNGNLQGEDTTLVVQLFAKPVALATSPPENKGATSHLQPAKLETKVEAPPSVGEAPKAVAPAAEGKQVQPSASKPLGGTIPLLPLIKNVSPSQGVTLALLIFIGLLFLVDSLIIFRKRHVRVGSHSFAHAAMILLLIALTLLYGKGAIL